MQITNLPKLTLSGIPPLPAIYGCDFCSGTAHVAVLGALTTPLNALNYLYNKNISRPWKEPQSTGDILFISKLRELVF